MWKKRLIWRNESVVFNSDVKKETVKSDPDDSIASSSGESLNNNTNRYSVRNGDFVPDKEGSLVISYHYVPVLNNNPDSIPDDSQQKPEDLVMVECVPDPVMQEYVPDPAPEQEEAMDLSLVKVEMKEEAVTMTSRDQDSGYNPSPPLVVDLTNTPDEVFTQPVRFLTSYIITLYLTIFVHFSRDQPSCLSLTSWCPGILT